MTLQSAPWELHTGDCRTVMRAQQLTLCADAIVCDPPYELGFMGQSWDRRGVAFDRETWVAARAVAQPGAYLVAFGGTRTYHRLTCAIEDAGWEIHDCLMWLYGQGYPKHRSKLKPAWEPIVLARNPAKQATPLNIDACRIPVSDAAYARNASGDRGHGGTRATEDTGATDLRVGGGAAHDAGRWPANVLLDDEAAAARDAQSGTLTSGANPRRRGSDKFRTAYGAFSGERECTPARGLDTGGASRFFYTAKASRTERDAGLEGFATGPLNWSAGPQAPGTFQSAGTNRDVRNPHPTVKPLALMRWLCRLVTPPGGLILDPFMGSGSTGAAARLEDRCFVGIDEDPRWVAIAEARIAFWNELEVGA